MIRRSITRRHSLSDRANFHYIPALHGNFLSIRGPLNTKGKAELAGLTVLATLIPTIFVSGFPNNNYIMTDDKGHSRFNYGMIINGAVGAGSAY